MPTHRNRAVILDRDGTLIKQVDGEYVTKPEQIEILPRVGEIIRKINEAGWLVCVATNQQAVAKGICTNEDVKNVNNALTGMLAVSDAQINSFVWCPHSEDDGCYCRKPRPGLLYRLAVAHHLDLRECLMIGDSESDMLAARAALCQYYGVKTNVGLQQWDPARLAHVPEHKVLKGRW